MDVTGVGITTAAATTSTIITAPHGTIGGNKTVSFSIKGQENVH